MRTPVHRRLMELEAEQVNPGMTRRLLWGDRIMLSHLEFKRGAVVPVHEHDNEQITYCVSGLMRFTFPTGELLLHGGEVLVIPSGVPHGAVMVEDTVEMDFFSPPRQDWIERTDVYLRAQPEPER
jgi:quercetin dioxygenase-like cupin family protein